MPRQQVFLKKRLGDRRIEVIKTYDQTLAREAFAEMDEAAQTHLWNSLRVEDSYAAEDIPAPSSPYRADFLWDEVMEAAREDGNLLTFFVVTGGASSYVSPDWPSAEAFATGG